MGCAQGTTASHPKSSSADSQAPAKAVDCDVILQVDSQKPDGLQISEDFGRTATEQLKSADKRNISKEAPASAKARGKQLKIDTSVATPNDCTFNKGKRRSAQHLDSALRLRCCERKFEGQDQHPPVKVVVFDLDETLTLATFMPKGEWNEFPEAKKSTIVGYSFESPFVEGCRLDKLRVMLDNLIAEVGGKDDAEFWRERKLCVLSRNAHGVAAVLGLLQSAGLAKNFSAIWSMPWRAAKRSHGAYQENGEWKFFEPPCADLKDHKADWLLNATAYPKKWFPSAPSGVTQIKLEEVVLVDDQRANFQNDSGLHLFRCCKVARFDADYKDKGILKDMGGIGAHSDKDYDHLLSFVEEPWTLKEKFQIACHERPFMGDDKRRPVKLVVFDFDETLTVATFVPSDPDFPTKMDWLPRTDSNGSDWTKEELLTYNFESPYVEEGRIAKLFVLLKELSQSGRVLCILTRHDNGVIAVLNLLKLAGLADYFSAIWGMPWCESRPNGLYREQGKWKSFEPPVNKVHDHKADALDHLCDNVPAWFPQVGGADPGNTKSLGILHLDEVLIVDDERGNFSSDLHSDTVEQILLPRYCKVARYDADYRDCGHVSQLGGLGSHDETDYEILKKFVDSPWSYRHERKDKEDGDKVTSQGSLPSICDDSWCRQNSVLEQLERVQPEIIMSPTAQQVGRRNSEWFGV